MTRVMIALDGTELDLEIAKTARKLFGESADFWAVNVQDALVADPPVGGWPVAFPVGYGAAYPYHPADLYAVRPDARTSEEILEEVERRAHVTAERSGLEDAHVVAETGDPAEAISRAARDHDVDVIVVGTHDRSWWSRLVNPSVARRLTDDAPVPVLLVTEAT